MTSETEFSKPPFPPLLNPSILTYDPKFLSIVSFTSSSPPRPLGVPPQLSVFLKSSAGGTSFAFKVFPSFPPLKASPTVATQTLSGSAFLFPLARPVATRYPGFFTIAILRIQSPTSFLSVSTSVIDAPLLYSA